MWRFQFSLEAEVDFARLTRAVQMQVAAKLRWFEANFTHIVPHPLGGKWAGFFKLRVGDWRVVYEIRNPEQLVMLHVIDHRSRIYRRTPPRT